MDLIILKGGHATWVAVSQMLVWPSAIPSNRCNPTCPILHSLNIRCRGRVGAPTKHIRWSAGPSEISRFGRRSSNAHGHPKAVFISASWLLF